MKDVKDHVKRILLDVIEKIDEVEEAVKGPEEMPNAHYREFNFEADRGQTIEETHRRQTFLIRNEIVAELNELARNKSKGFKTHFVNHAIEKFIEQFKERKDL